jgi:hypothetical protein
MMDHEKRKKEGGRQFCCLYHKASGLNMGMQDNDGRNLARFARKRFRLGFT